MKKEILFLAQVKLITLAGGKMVSAMHAGPFEKLGDAWSMIYQWV